MKMHRTLNLLFRNNVLRHIRHANGIWLDIGNTNDRITGNIFADIPGDVNPHAVHIEGSDALNEIDNNIFDHLTGGILIRDTNHVIIAYNLFLDCAKVCVDTVSGINGPRPIAGHTNDVHDLRVFGNVFSGMGQSAIEFNNSRNFAEGNVYGAPPGRRMAMQSFLRVKFPEPADWDNLQSWRDQQGWDKSGTMAEMTASLDADTLQLNTTIKGDLKPLGAPARHRASTCPTPKSPGRLRSGGWSLCGLLCSIRLNEATPCGVPLLRYATRRLGRE